MLERPPSERYRATESPPDAAGSLTQAVAFGLVAAVVCCLILFGFAALASFSAGLVVVALFLGRIVGLSVRSGAGTRVSSAARASAAILLSLGAVTVALVATWAFSRLVGGILGLPEYLGETLGPIVPLAYMLATLGAWWGAE
jgi:hypothetical protein